MFGLVKLRESTVNVVARSLYPGYFSGGGGRERRRCLKEPPRGFVVALERFFLTAETHSEKVWFLDC